MGTPSFHANNRQRFMSQMGPGSVALIGSPPEVLRNGDAEFPYRQCSDVYYLTGFSEPSATVVLRPGSDDEFHLFVRPKDPAREIWDGRRAGVEGACDTFGADQAYPAKELRARLETLLSNTEEFYYSFGLSDFYDALVIETLVKLRRRERVGKCPPKRIIDPSLSLHELRLHKTPEELTILRNAMAITDEAHRACMHAAGAGVGEHELAALLDYTFRRRGGTGPGYTSIVGGGKNATILHYIENNTGLNDGDLLLIDAGCELGFYTTDVTRTFPVNGAFSEAQRLCYEIVLDAESQAIKMVKPGVTLDEIHDRCVEILCAGMIEIGLLEGDLQHCISEGLYKKFYMHKSSHWLGMDVHDVGAYTVNGQPRPLAQGMVITIEPGLYIAADADVPSQFRGIGIRIEDDILVTDTGYENLSAGIPKSVDEIEAACKGR